MKKMPDFEHEIALWEKGFYVIGIDEVGRGAFAGPLVLAAVCFKPVLNKKEIKRLEALGINDSKKLTPQRREQFSKQIKKEAFQYSFCSINVEMIDKIGIGGATHLAVRKLAKSIMYKVESIKCKKRKGDTKYLIQDTKYFLLIDAFYVKYVRGVGLSNQKAIIHGDEKSISIAAASIIAKVKRDKIMKKLHKIYPVYDWEKNKGYGTLTHRNALKKNGKTKHHREAFIRNVIKNVS